MPTTSGSYLELWSHTTPNASARMTNPPTVTIKRRRKPLTLTLSPTGRGEGEGLLTVREVACISSIGVQPRGEKVDAPEAEDDHAQAARHRERRVAGQRDGDVDVDPIAVQRRHQRLRDLIAVRQERRGAHRDEPDRHDERPDGFDPVLELQEQVARDDREGDVGHRLELVGPG